MKPSSYPFNGEILKRLIESEEVYPGGYLKSINGQHPWYIYRQGPSKLAVMLAPIGAPMIVGQLEELAARGFKNFYHFRFLWRFGPLN